MKPITIDKTIYIDNIEVSTSSSADTLFWMNNSWNPGAPNQGTESLVVVIRDTNNDLNQSSSFSCSKLIVEPNTHINLIKGTHITVIHEVIVKNQGKVTIGTGSTLETTGP